MAFSVFYCPLSIRACFSHNLWLDFLRHVVCSCLIQIQIHICVVLIGRCRIFSNFWSDFLMHVVCSCLIHIHVVGSFPTKKMYDSHSDSHLHLVIESYFQGRRWIFSILTVDIGAISNLVYFIPRCWIVASCLS